MVHQGTCDDVITFVDIAWDILLDELPLTALCALGKTCQKFCWKVYARLTPYLRSMAHQLVCLCFEYERNQWPADFPIGYSFYFLNWEKNPVYGRLKRSVEDLGMRLVRNKVLKAYYYGLSQLSDVAEPDATATTTTTTTTTATATATEFGGQNSPAICEVQLQAAEPRLNLVGSRLNLVGSRLNLIESLLNLAGSSLEPGGTFL